ncbi:hypothetical protein [Streptomyces sp. NPDC050704]|uniref:hypothetical protein n=1 Tax=Streptomyces sp. NPDC050704 TaxID=3157219 RepID=UPI0034497D54
MPFDPSSPHDDPFENRFADALREAGGAYETDRHALVTAGAARGRGLRLRRRAAMVGGVAGIALVAIGGTLLLPGSGDDSRKQSVATGPTTPAPAASTTPTPTSTPTGEDGAGTTGGESKDEQVPETHSSIPPSPSGPAIERTLVGLLRPEGVKVVDRGGQDTEYAYLVLDDGKGRSLVQINVQPDMRDVEDQLFGADAEVLPDGTKVATQQGPGEKGGAGVVMWTADTIRPGGLRVVISAFNSGAQNTAATRETPALTIEQLKAIATSEEWKKFQPEPQGSPESEGVPQP